MERGVSALEKIAADMDEDTVLKVETGPPVCPNCEKMNPNVRVHEAEATGALAEFLIQAQCLSCNKVFYALPYQWQTTKTVNEAELLMREKLDMTGMNGGDQGTNSGA